MIKSTIYIYTRARVIKYEQNSFDYYARLKHLSINEAIYENAS